jgi:hypothetical protein
MAHYHEQRRASYGASYRDRRRPFTEAPTHLLTLDEPPTIPYEPQAAEPTPRTTVLPDRRTSRVAVRGYGPESGELPTLRRPRSAKSAADSVWHLILAAFVAGIVMGIFVMSSMHPR